ncbi:RluA family pseudouridine synthase [bacterium]|nr:RluA family pseudouridine synthase [bacterium]
MEEERIIISVPGHKTQERLDTFLVNQISHISRSQIQKLIKEGFVQVDGKRVKAHHVVRPLEKIVVVFPKQRVPDVVPEDIPLDIIYEDGDLLVINKKAGMVVHPAFGHSSGTLVNALLVHCLKLSSVNDPYRPGIVHRIDKDTSGLLVVAKNNTVHEQLANQFRDKKVLRQYVAIVWGHVRKSSGTVETFLARSIRDRKKIGVTSTGKNAVTHFEVEERLPLTSLITLRLETGRTHQIRVHLAHMGHPVFGDHTYGGRGRQLGGLNKKQTALGMELLQMMKRQALHAKTLGFVHPATGKEHFFDSDLPEDMKQLLDRLHQVRDEDWV